MPAEWRSNIGSFIGASERAQKTALVAAAEAYMADIKRALEHGYTSGDFVTGANVNAVGRSDPEMTADGAQIAVGSTSEYALYWEVGHQNLFTRKHERVEKWVPTLLGNREKYAAIAAAEIKAAQGAA